MSIGSTLRALRIKRGLTVRAVADHCGVSHSAVEHWEGGRREPPIDMLRKYGEAIGVVIDVVAREPGIESDTMTDAQRALLRAVMAAMPLLTDDSVTCRVRGQRRRFTFP